MAGLYFYVPGDKIDGIIGCGLKLSEWFDRELSIPGISGRKKVIKALLNPRDDRRLKDNAYRCLRLEVSSSYCVVGDSVLYTMGLNEPAMMELYAKRLIPLRDYRFGTFFKPEVLIMSSVLPDCIEVTGKALDIPILYENSMSLYLSNFFAKHEEEWNDAGNHILYGYLAYLESRGRTLRFEDKKHENAVFFYKGSNEYTVLKIPEEGIS